MISGGRTAPDTITYSMWADRLIQMHFDFGRYLSAAEYWNVPPLLYMFFVTIVAIAKLIAGSAWKTAIVSLQVVADCTTAAIVTGLAARFGTPISAAAAIVFYALNFDIATWVRYPLTDILFMTASFAAFALAVARERGRTATVALIVTTVCATVLRPVGFLWLIFIVVTVGIRRAERLEVPLRRAAAAAACALVAAHTYFMMHPHRWPLNFLSVGIRWNARQYQAGVVVQDRWAIAHSPPQGALEYLALTLDRIAHFYAFVVTGFSARHMVIAAAYYVPIFVLAIVGYWNAKRRPDHRAFIAGMSGAIIVTAGLWHALTNLDFDWRYRLPLLPHAILLAAWGFGDLVKRRRPL